MFKITVPKSSTPFEVSLRAKELDVCSLPSTSIPNGFQVMLLGEGGSAVSSYGYDNGLWIDESTFEAVESTSLTGTVLFRNPSSADVEFVW